MKISTCDFSFPKLPWEQTLRLVRDLGMQGIDVALFEGGRSHLAPREVFSNIRAAASRINAAVLINGLQISDVFAQPGRVPEENAVNDPDPLARRRSRDLFHRTLELALRCNALHLTLLPGVHFATEAYEDSLKRSAEELTWRTEIAKTIGIPLGIEPHVGSIVQSPRQVNRLLVLAPTISLTLDYSHFVCQGIPDCEIEPLLPSASHFHARAACQNKLQAPMKENTIDFPRVVQEMKRTGYSGFVAVEYVWIEWMHCNEVDNLTETILMRDVLCGAEIRDCDSCEDKRPE
jgi:sugar phosphate isomerase/epimerase